jgi:hypothetical protein
MDIMIDEKGGNHHVARALQDRPQDLPVNPHLATTQAQAIASAIPSCYRIRNEILLGAVLVYRFIKQYSDRPQLTRRISSSGGPRGRR